MLIVKVLTGVIGVSGVQYVPLASNVQALPLSWCPRILTNRVTASGPDFYGEDGLTHGLLQNYNLLLTRERIRIWEGPDGVLRPGSPLVANYRTKIGCTIPLKSLRPLGEAPVTWSTAPRSNIRCCHQAASEAHKPSDSDDLYEAHIVCDAPKPCRETCLHEVNMGCHMHGLGTIRPYNKMTTMKPIQKYSIQRFDEALVQYRRPGNYLRRIWKLFDLCFVYDTLCLKHKSYNHTAIGLYNSIYFWHEYWLA